MNTPTVMILILAAIFVAAAVPVLIQLFKTLRSARQLIDSTGPQIERLVMHVSQVARRVDGLGARLEPEVEALKPIVDTAAKVTSTVGGTVDAIRSALTFGSALTPAVITGVRAFFSAGDAGRHHVQEPWKGHDSRAQGVGL